MSRPTPEHVAMRDQILALLRDRGVMTTTELGQAMLRPNIWHSLPPAELALLRSRIPGLKTMVRTPYWELYPQLAAMERLGIIQRVLPGQRPLAWMLVTEAPGEEAQPA